MLIVNVKNSDSLDQALKNYKRKYDKTGIIKELRKRKDFTKPSVTRREEILSAVYRTQKYQ